MKTFDNFTDAKAECAETDMVCGTQMHDGTPVHFVMSRNATDEQIADMAFFIREGRPVSEVEKWYLALARSLREPVEAQPA